MTRASAAPRTRRIVLISTGGTIASRWQGTGYAADASGDDVLAGAALPEDVAVEVVDLFRVNSSRMTTRHQLELLRTVHETLADPDVAGIVVTHGTDTLEETALLLDLHHHDPRPVVLTGAQLPFDAANGDGPGNLCDALRVAASVRDLGVLVVFDGLVHAARGTVKVQTLAADAFADPSGEPLGKVGFGGVAVRRRPVRPAPLALPAAARTASDTAPAAAADGAAALPRVDVLTHHSDGDPVLLRAALAAGARGLVLVGTGAGNATPEIVDAVAAAVAAGVPVAVTTRVPSGPVAAVYTGGGAVDLAAAGAHLTGTLRAGQARIVLLAALLAEPSDAERRAALATRLLMAPEDPAATATPPATVTTPAPATAPADADPALGTAPAAGTVIVADPALATRREHDLLGDRDVPADAYWGIHTLRATENFPITGIPISAYPHLIEALAAVKESAAVANERHGLLPEPKAGAIVAACREIRAGALHEEFVVDVVQGGAGTSTNMNANEVVANRALELLGHAKGEYAHLHPNEDVNLSQSTNDVYPTALRVATISAARGLVEAMAVLEGAFATKAAEFSDVVKMGRTQLQDAVPMTLGQEFSTYAVMLEEDRTRLAEAVALLHEINLGATAIGTGLNAPAGYAETARGALAEITGLPLATAANLVEATQDCGAFVQLSGVLKRIAVKLSKTCNDLRLLSSGPRAGLGEINLPPVQAGSSIMPGKVNPVIPEVVNQVAFEVIGNDMTVTMAAEAGQLQLNAFEPVILHALSKSIASLRAACLTLAERCVTGITANVDVLRAGVENSIGLATALNPHIGYTAATALAQEALRGNRGVAELVLERGLLPADRLAELLHPDHLTGGTARSAN